MHWPLSTLAWVLAISASAIPLGPQPGQDLHPFTERGDGDVIPGRDVVRVGPDKDSNADGFPVHKALVARGKTTYTVFEAEKIQAASEIGVNFFKLMDTLTVLTLLLDRKQIPWVVAGGFAHKLYGQKRYTTDIDIVAQTNVRTLKAILAKDNSFLLPAFKMGMDHIRVYHNQGTDYNPRYIEVDFIIAGRIGTPGDLAPWTNVITAPNSAKKEIRVNLIKPMRLFISKAWTVASENRYRRKGNKDLGDLTWVMQRFPKELKGVKDYLNECLRTIVIKRLVDANSPFAAKARSLFDVAGNPSESCYASYARPPPANVNDWLFGP